LALHSGFAAEYLTTGYSSSRLGAQSPHRVPYNVFRTSDDRYVFLVTNNEIWPRLCRAVGLETMIEDPRFASNQARVEHREEVNAAIASRIGTADSNEVCRWFVEHDVPHAKVATLGEALDSQHAAEHDMILEIGGALRGSREPVRVMGTPIKMSGSGHPVRFGPPVLGEANDFVLHDLLGYPAKGSGDEK
jgi:crotonobetainyl-CoA:carnitine CoA-transferase CaiB-like acyl-CoA transferase